MTNITNLPQVNFSSAPGYTEWQYLHEVYSQEFYTRTLIGSTPGIVDKVGDPTVDLDSSRPLVVSVNVANPLSLDITPGYAITPNYQLIILDSALSAIPLPTVVVDTVYVVAVEYVLVPSEDVQVNHFNILTEIRDERPSNTPWGDATSTLQQAITVVTLADFNNISLFPEERKNSLVVIAHCSARADAVTGQLSILMDLTRTTFTYNRPWFSYNDIDHRVKVGSGVVTDTNPHGLAIQDLSGTSGLTLYQQILPKGGVFAKDFTYYGYPGTFCTELISLNRYEDDTDGSITSDPALGIDPLTGRYFVTLTKVPVRVGSLYFTGTPWKSVPYTWKPGTRYLILGSLEQPLSYGNSLTVEYFSVSALMPPQESLSQGVQSFQVTEPLTGSEWIYTGGVVLDNLAGTSVNLSADLGPIKKAYNILCTAEGTLVPSPQNLVPVVNVADLITEGQIPINQAPLNGLGVYWTIGLTRVPESVSNDPDANLNLRILVNGVDELGSTVEETVVFYASQWKDQSAEGLEEEPLQFRRTANKYQLVNYIQTLNTTSVPDNAGNAAILSMWANIEEATANKELANVASFFWDGLGARRILDQRTVGTTVQRIDQRQIPHPGFLGEDGAGFIQELLIATFDPPLVNQENIAHQLAAEADDDRLVGETWSVFSESDASGEIKIVDFQNITPGMTITIARDKVLKFVEPSAVPLHPDPSEGEVGIPTSLLTGNIEVLNNLVSTINNDVFDSTWQATLAQTGDKVTLTRKEANPEGFVQCKRQIMTFTPPSLTFGSITFQVAGASVSIANLTIYGGTHALSLEGIAEEVNALSDTTGVTAVVVDATYLVFNGDIHGRNFLITTPAIVGPAIQANVGTIADPFTYTNPTGGFLPTPHLPQRYKKGAPWHYESRALQWVDVTLQASISFSGDVTTAVQDGDLVQIVPNKVLVARKGNPNPPIYNPGEFLVTASLVDTLVSMRDAVNNPAFASGCHAEVDPTNTKLVLTIGGYAAAQIVLLQEAVTGTWKITPYAPHGVGSDGSQGFLKSLYPLESAEWRYQLIEPAAPVDSFLPADVSVGTSTIAITAHGLYNGDQIFIRNTGNSDVPPSPLLQNQPYYVISATNNTFQLSLTLGGSAITLINVGAGVNTVYVAKPFGVGDWSPYEAMEEISSTAYKFKGPGASSLYAVQVRLQGIDDRPNKFSLYQITPENGVTTAALDTRLTDLENEIIAARGSLTTLDDRLNTTIDTNGDWIKDVELTDSRSSMILPLSSTLKERLDVMDGISYWTGWGEGTYLDPRKAGHLGIPNQLISGPIDGNNNSNFFIGGSPSGNIARVAAGNTQPLIIALGGRYYKIPRIVHIDFASKASGDYYINAEATDALGVQIFNGTILSATSTVVTSNSGFTSTQFIGDPTYSLASLLTAGTECVLYIPSLDLFSPITASSATTATVAGTLPTLTTGTPYEVWSVRECALTVTPFVTGDAVTGTDTVNTKTTNRLPIARASWNFTTQTFLATETYGFRYQDRYVSDLFTAADVNYLASFPHNLGFIPGSLSLYYYDNNTTTNPILVENEAIFRVSTTKVEVKARYTDRIVTNWSGSKIIANALLRLVAGR